MSVYLRPKFQVSRKILASCRQGSNFTHLSPTAKETHKTPTQITGKTKF